ncbi:hypothetical protein [Aquicoccus porphyridii]|uniref:Uncharacterized protein n=1 Tax=Aquicoccus porphyridii TaxID=1852029 RepID=A0A5A9ZHK0_9RHOB|nr:hypothetical protein [Aquicoccus porphyridii]KAA0916728.1 hypothetical protein FLO80_07860 [Aquicoccus porphyridii]RAI53853.1 hypothetical protein DOO74_10535 [Rhodobacteraceae bacterium AsT-22]
MRSIFAAILMLSIATPALAETAKERAARCAAQSEIIVQAVEMRQKRRSEARAKKTILETTDDRLAPSVPLLVGFVYTLHRSDLKRDVRGSFLEQCNAYKP